MPVDEVARLKHNKQIRDDIHADRLRMQRVMAKHIVNKKETTYWG